MKLKNQIRYTKDNDSNVSIIKIIYPSKLTKEDNKSTISILSYVLTSSCDEYREYKEFKDHLNELGILNISFNTKIIFDTLFIYFDLEIPSKNVYREFELEKAFKFFIDTILHPYAEDGAFNEDKFMYEKDFIYKKYASRIDSFYFRCSNKYFNLIDKKDILERNYENRKNDIAAVTPSNAYEFYKRHVLNNKFLVFVFGNYDKNDIEPLFEKYLPVVPDTVDVKMKKLVPFKFKNIKDTIGTNESNQSIYYITYKIKNVTKDDLDYFDIFFEFLSSRNEGTLFDILRIKNSLIYDIDYMSFGTRGFFTIELDISDSNKNKVDGLIDEFFENIKDKKLLTKIYDEVLEEYKIEQLEAMDNDFYKFDKKIDRTLKFETLEDIIKFHEKKDVEALYNLFCKVEKVNTLYLRGEKDE